MFLRILLAILVFCWMPVVHVASAGETAAARSIDPRADKVLRQMSDYLSSLTEFILRAENTTDETAMAGSKVQFGHTADIYVKRPDRLRANVIGDLENQQFFFDGKSVTLFNKDKKVYATVKAQGELEAALEHARNTFGISAPLADLIYPDAYQVLTKDALFGHYIGLHLVRGVQCHHLLFVHEDIDWQIWIENSQTPLPRKMVITSKWLAGGPQFTALMSYWKTSARLSEDLFVFTAPETAQQVEVLSVDTGVWNRK